MAKRKKPDQTAKPRAEAEIMVTVMRMDEHEMPAFYSTLLDGTVGGKDVRLDCALNGAALYVVYKGKRYAIPSSRLVLATVKAVDSKRFRVREGDATRKGKRR